MCLQLTSSAALLLSRTSNARMLNPVPFTSVSLCSGSDFFARRRFFDGCFALLFVLSPLDEDVCFLFFMLDDATKSSSATISSITRPFLTSDDDTLSSGVLP